jgi:hypothetical protein
MSGFICTPDEAFPVLPQLPQLPEVVQPTSWLLAQHGRVFRRRIRANGSIQIDKHTYYIDAKLAKHPVLVHLDGNKRCFHLSVDGKVLPKVLPIKDLLEEPLPIQDYLEHLQREAISIARYREMLWMQSGETA